MHRYGRDNRYARPVHGQHELRLPPGWEDCPPYSEPLQLPSKEPFKVIPSKVPLQPAYRKLLRNPDRLYTLRGAVDEIEQRYRVRVGMVLDLTNSSRYYEFDMEFPDAVQRNIAYVKVPCKGRGQVPSPEAVNHAVFEMYRLWANYPDAYVFMHCTHGFNRTGYVMSCAAVRLAGNKGMTVDRAVRRFAESRAPGIYKDAYINELFRYHHERRMPNIRTPPVPGWKGVDGDEEDDPDVVPPAEPDKVVEIDHQRIEELGEPIPHDEMYWIQQMVYSLITGQEIHPGQQLRFPGSQPVSLAASNLALLQQQRYWVSWKADGTRYLLLIEERGCYLIDRSFKVVRLQMRFPTPAKPPQRNPQDGIARGEYPVGRPHTTTLLDGEMVVDTDEQGHKYRRYLVYDMAVLNEKPLVTEPWIKRYLKLEEWVVGPRNKERSYIQGQLPANKEKYRTPPLNYDYASEPFGVRRKEFWPLYRAHKVIAEMIPILSHESDGLILQSCDSGYVANTDNALLKYKFAHLNSVDFKLQVEGSIDAPRYRLWLMDARGRRVGPPPLRSIDTPIQFPPDVSGWDLADCIIECTWLPDQGSWYYHRTRVDKDTPNAFHVYQKVMASINDNITEGPLLDYLDAVFWNVPLYEKDRVAVPPDRVPAQLPPPPSANPVLLARPPPQAVPDPEPHEGAEAGGEWADGVPPDEQREVPRTPPYWGPEPTPPHDPSVPVDPSMWVEHDPSTYPQELLPPHLRELPPPPETYDGPDSHYAEGAHGQEHAAQGHWAPGQPQGPAEHDHELGHRDKRARRGGPQHHGARDGPGHAGGPPGTVQRLRYDPDVCPYYTRDSEDEDGEPEPQEAAGQYADHAAGQQGYGEAAQGAWQGAQEPQYDHAWGEHGVNGGGAGQAGTYAAQDSEQAPGPGGGDMMAMLDDGLGGDEEATPAAPAQRNPVVAGVKRGGSPPGDGEQPSKMQRA